MYRDRHEEAVQRLHYGDLTDSTNLIRIVQQVRLHEIYRLAAQIHVGASFETPISPMPVFILMSRYDDEGIVNVGSDEDLSIRELAELVARITGFNGTLEFDVSKPDGTPRKLLDVSFLRSLGLQAQIPLEEGVKRTYAWFKTNSNHFRD